MYGIALIVSLTVILLTAVIAFAVKFPLPPKDSPGDW